MKTKTIAPLCFFLLGISIPFFDAEAATVPASQKMEDADVEFLVDGVEAIPPAGIPGPICVFGDNARSIIAAKLGDSLAPVVAALKYEKGRVVAFGHGAYFNKSEMTKTPDCERLLKNILDWLGNNRKPIQIAVVGAHPFADYLKEIGYDVTAVPNLDDPLDLAKFQIVIVDAWLCKESHLPKLTKFIADGGGLMTASLGWGWLQISGKSSLKTEHVGNLLCAPMGIAWADGGLRPTGKQNGVDVYETKNTSPFMKLNAALDAVLDHEISTKTLEPAEISQALTTINLAIQAIPDKQAAKLAQLESFANKEVVPNAENKVRKNSMVSEVIAITLQTEKFLISQRNGLFPEGGVPALKAGSDFPGAVPSDAKPVARIVEIDTTIPDWHSVGLYAAPGQTITVRVPKECVSSEKNRAMKVRIGCHIDLTWHHGEWIRYPEITLEVPILAEETKLANPFGGLVYVVVPRAFKNNEGNKGTASVEISGCVESPLYVHGKTSVEDWKKTIRNAPGPWGELASDRIIISLPSTGLRELDNPDKVMEFWNKVLDSCAELASMPKERDRPLRFASDRQLSAGYLHSGYPLMAHMNLENFFISVKDHPEEGWGFFHEIGHEHQASDWTFDGTAEVTVNLFTLYVFDKIFQWDPKHPNVYNIEKERAKRDAYFEKGSPFDTWKRDPFLALTMYVDLQQEFGWDAFIKTFKEYLDLPNGERPKNDDQKRDQWMIRFSKTVGRNLGPFFLKWGVPVSQWALDSIKDLPLWEPYQK